eukprot:TRINITY_DN1127_c0_g1_i1.p2 TRINITY_DN1127_c0_g1~~TRINITY_DN1127_c0_g1_i1.p2  ORF type:complete len:118 (-),score=22.54 TRINITY_DN1127_c0_g1_i1:387-740(-)
MEGHESGFVSAPELKPIVRKAKQLLHRRLRIGVTDGRVFVGKFHCLDKQGNIIIVETQEFRFMEGGCKLDKDAEFDLKPEETEQRSLGIVLIPARWQTFVQLECSTSERMGLLSLES